MRILVLSKYGSLAAASRHRFLLYGPALRAAGHDVELAPFFDDACLARRLAGQHRLRDTAKAYRSRFQALRGSVCYDLVVVHMEALPFLPDRLALWAGLGKVPFLYEGDDAAFHQYNQHARWLVRRLLGRKLEPLLRASCGAIVGNEYLADWAGRHTDPVTVIPTAVDLSRFPAQPPSPGPSDRPLVVGWIGSPSTAPMLAAIAAPLARFQRETSARIVAVGSGPLTLPGVDLEVRPWSLEREVSDLADFDIGIMPLPDTPWARGKCGFKLVQYMAAWKPVIASPVGVNREMVTDGVNGFLAGAADEWFEALMRLGDPRLRKACGEVGHQRVAQRYCLEVTAPRVVAAYEAAGTGVAQGPYR